VAEADSNGPPPGRATGRFRPRARSLWRHPDFLKLWTGETISQFGTQVTLLGLPLIAILLLDANPFQVGLLGTVEFLPFILLGLPAGAWVDRLRRRPILITGDLGRALSLASIPIVYELGHLTLLQLYVVAFVNGILTVFFDVAYQAYLPSIVERDQLVEGNSKLEGSRATAQLAGPGMAGGLIQWIGAPVAIIADAVSYVGSAFFVFLIRRPEPPVEVHPEGKTKIRREIAQGLRYVVKHPLLRSIAACTGTSNLFSQMAFAVFLLYAVRRLGLTPGEIGIVFGIGNVGALLGAVSGTAIARKLGVGPTIVASALVFGPAWILIPLASRSFPYPYLIGAMFLGSFGGVVYNVNQVSLRQAITPLRMQGRMNATMRFMVWGTIPIGSFIGGVLGNTIGLKPTLWVAAIGGCLAFLPVLLSPVRSLERIPDPPDEPGQTEQAVAEPEVVPQSQLPPVDVSDDGSNLAHRGSDAEP
jgi:MFS family permease